MNTYLKVSEHRAHAYDGTETMAHELSELIGIHRANPHYMIHLGIHETKKDFTGKLAIFTRNGLIYVLPGEVVMHDVVTNEWYSVTQEQFDRQYRPFSFGGCCGIPGPDHEHSEVIRGPAGQDDGSEDTRL